MLVMVIGLVLFLGTHSAAIFAPGFRDSMAARSPLGWKAAYGVLSLIGLVLIVHGYAQARLDDPVMLYAPPTFLRHLVGLLMLPFFVLFFAPYFPGRIKTVTKHPQLVAVKLWAVSHLLANGMLHDVVLFGAFLAWAVVDRISLKRRAPREPAVVAPAAPLNDVILVVVGLAAYAAFAFYAHAAWIGVSPFG